MPSPIRAAWIMAVLLLSASGAMATAGFSYRPVGMKIYQADDVIEAHVPGGGMNLGGFVHNLSHALHDVLESRQPGAGFSGAVVIIIKPRQSSR